MRRLRQAGPRPCDLGEGVLTRPRLSVFIATSLDGFIANRDGSIEWLEAAAGDGEDYGYDAFLADVDALAMGRGTYDHIASIEPLPFGDRPVYVFTHRPPAARAGVTFWSVGVDEAIDRWTDAGHARVYVDGGALIRAFLLAGAIDDLTITVAPVVLADGIPLFAGGGGASLDLLETRSFPSGMVHLRYTVDRGATTSGG